MYTVYVNLKLIYYQLNTKFMKYWMLLFIKSKYLRIISVIKYSSWILNIVYKFLLYEEY